MLVHKRREILTDEMVRRVVSEDPFYAKATARSRVDVRADVAENPEARSCGAWPASNPSTSTSPAPSTHPPVWAAPMGSSMSAASSHPWERLP